MASVDAIRVEGLRRAYGSVVAVDGVDFAVRAGEVFALLGPNGAGKTTTVEILEGHRRRDAGDVRVLGHDPAQRSSALLEQVGIVLQSSGVERYLTVREILDLYRGYYPRPRPTAEILRLVDLEDKADSRLRTLSGGQRRRLDLGIALCGDPRLLFLDEPTTGFDPAARRQAWDLVRALTGEGRTVLLTTHFMDEASALADRIAIMVNGRIAAEGTPARIAALASPTTTICAQLPPGAPELPGALDHDRHERAPDGTLTIHAVDPTRTLHVLTGWALEHGVALDGLSVARPSLEDAYLALTGGIEAADPTGRGAAPAGARPPA